VELLLLLQNLLRLSQKLLQLLLLLHHPHLLRQVLQPLFNQLRYRLLEEEVLRHR